VSWPHGGREKRAVENHQVHEPPKVVIVPVETVGELRGFSTALMAPPDGPMKRRLVRNPCIQNCCSDVLKSIPTAVEIPLFISCCVSISYYL